MHPTDFRQYSGVDPRPLTTEQLQEHLIRQMKHLRNSARLFDEGDSDEAVRLGTTVRILLHQTGQSHSLLGQLGLRDTIKWRDTGRYRSDYAAPDPGATLVISPTSLGVAVLAVGDPVPYFAAPLVAARVRTTSTVEWWGDTLIENSAGEAFSRKDLVSAMANKDGGAHVDRFQQAAYNRFVVTDLNVQYASEPGDWRSTNPPGGWKTFHGNLADASMRQIAYEVESTLYGLDLDWLPGQGTIPRNFRAPMHLPAPAAVEMRTAGPAV